MHYEKFQDGTVKCIENDIPFELSYGWNWERLGNLSSVIQYGLSDSAKTSGTHRLLRITDIQNGKVNWENVPFTTIEDEDSYLLEKGDIVFARTGATVGKSYLINDLPYPSVYASYLIRIRLLNGLSPKYLSLFFNSKCYWNQIIDKSVGSGQPNCNGTSLKNLFIPVPPTDEQLLIIEECKSLLKCISVIDEKKEELMFSVNLIRSKILDLAIRGQLVPQDPNDEPASVLLERIREQKQQLVKEGKLKAKDIKKESIIFKGEDNSYYEKIGSKITCIIDEIPFVIPNNWQYIRLKDYFELLSGRDLQKQDYNDKQQGIPYITGASNFINNEIIIERWTEKPQVISKKGDLLITCKGTVGKMAYNTFGDSHIARQIMAIRNPFKFDRDYLQLCMLYYIVRIKNAAKGMIPGISRDDLLNILLPIPPIKYQKKLVYIIKEYEKIINSIEKSLI